MRLHGGYFKKVALEIIMIEMFVVILHFIRHLIRVGPKTEIHHTLLVMYLLLLTNQYYIIILQALLKIVLISDIPR
jgi:hypothetical protein